MILKYNEFISLNESFQSSKLADIVKQHGKLGRYVSYFKRGGSHWGEGGKNPFYDLKDDEIIGVVESMKKFYELSKTAKHELYGIELEDKSVLVVTVGPEEIKKRIKSRHVGNLGKPSPYDDPHTPRIKAKLDELNHKKTLEKIKSINDNPEVLKRFLEYLKEILDSFYSDIDYDEEKSIENDTYYIDGEFEYDGMCLGLQFDYSVDYFNRSSKCGETTVDAEIELNNIYITDEETGDMFEVGGEIGGEIEDFLSENSSYVEKEAAGHIYDYYDYYGVSPSDFY